MTTVVAAKDIIGFGHEGVLSTAVLAEHAHEHVATETPNDQSYKLSVTGFAGLSSEVLPLHYNSRNIDKQPIEQAVLRFKRVGRPWDFMRLHTSIFYSPFFGNSIHKRFKKYRTLSPISNFKA